MAQSVGLFICESSFWKSRVRSTISLLLLVVTWRTVMGPSFRFSHHLAYQLMASVTFLWVPKRAVIPTCFLLNLRSGHRVYRQSVRRSPVGHSLPLTHSTVPPCQPLSG